MISIKSATVKYKIVHLARSLILAGFAFDFFVVSLL